MMDVMISSKMDTTHGNINNNPDSQRQQNNQLERFRFTLHQSLVNEERQGVPAFD